MKKLPFLLLTFLLYWQAETANAQLVKSIGLRTGFSYNFPGITETTILNGNKEVISDLNNYLFLFGELQIECQIPAENFSLLSNFSYISKGFTYRGSYGGYGSFGGSGSYLASAYANYATINPAIKYNYQLEKKRIYGFAGPYLSILVDHDQAFDHWHYVKVNNSYVQKKVLMLKPWTIGGTIGVGMNLKSRKDQLQYNLQIQYLHDISRTANYNFKETGPNHDLNYTFHARNKTLLFSFGAQYLFRKRE